MKSHKIGIFGGTFNPIHLGHLMIADNACRQFGLEKVIFMPTGHTPHKEFMGEDMSQHRKNMVQLAIEDNPMFDIDLRELESTTVNYTYSTLHQLNEEHPDTQFYFILGADSLFDFHLWRHPELICQEAIILAAVRAEMDEEKLEAQILFLTEKYQGEIHRIETPNFDVSSKMLRSRIHLGDTIRYMVPDQVIHYIQKNKLYS